MRPWIFVRFSFSWQFGHPFHCFCAFLEDLLSFRSSCSIFCLKRKVLLLSANIYILKLRLAWKWKVRLSNFSISKSNRTVRITHVTNICFLRKKVKKKLFKLGQWVFFSLYAQYPCLYWFGHSSVELWWLFHSGANFVSIKVLVRDNFFSLSLSLALTLGQHFQGIYDKLLYAGCVCDQLFFVCFGTSTKLIAIIIKPNPSILSYKSGQFQCSAIIWTSIFLDDIRPFRSHIFLYTSNNIFIYRNNFDRIQLAILLKTQFNNIFPTSCFLNDTFLFNFLFVDSEFRWKFFFPIFRYQ